MRGVWYRTALLCMACVSLHAHAVVTGQALLNTCAHALADDYTGVDAAMCDWYVNPCGICGVDAPQKDWCVPDTIPSAELAQIVVAELKEQSAQLPRPAKPFVRQLLMTRFPCRGAAVGPR